MWKVRRGEDEVERGNQRRGQVKVGKRVEGRMGKSWDLKNVFGWLVSHATNFRGSLFRFKGGECGNDCVVRCGAYHLWTARVRAELRYALNQHPVTREIPGVEWSSSKRWPRISRSRTSSQTCKRWINMYWVRSIRKVLLEFGLEWVRSRRAQKICSSEMRTDEVGGEMRINMWCSE